VILRSAVRAAVAALLVSLLPSIASAQSTCVIEAQGRSLAGATSEDPIEIDLDRPIGLAVTAGEEAVDRISVSVPLGPLSAPIWQSDAVQVAPGETDTVVVDEPGEYAVLGAGAYEVLVEATGCEPVRGWIRIVGRSPLTTVAGWLAIAVTGIGLALVAIALRSAFAGRRRIALGAIGGAVAGLGAVAVAQQFGVPLRAEVVAAATVVPAVIGGGVQAFASTAGAAPPAPAPAGAAPPAPAPPAGSGGAPAAAPPAPLPAPTAPLEPDQTRTAFARLECPDAVVVEREFEVIVGLAPTPDVDVVSEPMHLPDWTLRDYIVTVQIIADGMELARADAAWRIDLPVSAASPYPAVAVLLRPRPASAPVAATSIRALYSIGGQPVGLAVRPIAVVHDESMLSGLPAPPSPVGVDIGLPSAPEPPDLTIRLEDAASESGGRFLLQLLAADQAIDLPDAPLVVDLGDAPSEFLRHAIQAMNAVEGQPGALATLRGIGLTIADQLPAEFWRVFGEVAIRAAGRAPSVLFLSAEPYIPWGLAVVDPPLLPDAPPFMSTQCDVGRWVLGQRRPKMPPPTTLSVSSMSVVSGVYTGGSWQRLVEAEAEAQDLVQAYGATAVDATIPEVLGLLGGQPSADVIHFAVHGNYDPQGGEDGLILTDGLALDPLKVKGTTQSGTPFVFLNACQVGAGQRVLGDHAGMASAFLYSGAAAVVAPLWSIDDRVAREIARRFYEAVFDGASPAEFLRTIGQLASDETAATTTHLAYQFFGHPRLRMPQRHS
jgi:CHAT domain